VRGDRGRGTGDGEASVGRPRRSREEGDGGEEDGGRETGDGEKKDGGRGTGDGKRGASRKVSGRPAAWGMGVGVS
jgi:hypothetical protein